MRHLSSIASALLLIAVLATTSLVTAEEFSSPIVFPKPRGDTVTVSGISAGGFMAVQFEFAYSSLIKGAGIIAGGPYDCSGGSLEGATDCMYVPSVLSLSSMMATLASNAQSGLVDGTANIAGHIVALFSGTQDSVVNPGTMKLLAQMYQQLNVSADQLVTVFDVDAEHSWITSDYGNACSTLGSPFINNCALDFSRLFLHKAYLAMNVSWNETRGTPNFGSSLLRFSQVGYGASSSNSMSDHGYVYIPERCRDASMPACHVHVSFHGCKQDVSFVQQTFVKHTQLNEWAESNGIIVVYPQAAVNSMMGNPYGCFDWWGYADSNFAVKTGGQMSLVRRILADVLNGQIAPSPTPSPPGPPAPSGGPTPPSPPASCSNLPDGASCASTTTYIVCPVGLTFPCEAGTTCMGSNGFALCL